MWFITGLVIFTKVWVETSQSDFADGVYERNLYASHRKGGAVEFVPRFDLNLDGYPEIWSSSHGTGYTYVYWGSDSGYSVENRTSYRAADGGDNDAADFNIDGYPDFITCGLHDPSVRIFYGTNNGPDSNNYRELQVNYNESGYFADLNKDGWLDIVVGNKVSGYAGIFWGSASGYSNSNYQLLPAQTGCHNVEVADLDRNGYLDIIIPNDGASYNTIYWGSDSGYSPSNCLHLSNPGNPHGICVIDLDGDSILDLIFTSRTYDQAYLYRGTGSDFILDQVLNPGQGTLGGSYGGSKISDFNGDGYRDILFVTPGWPVIYWGSASGYSDDNRRFIMRGEWASGGFVGDFDFDGDVDIFIGDLNGYSYIAEGPGYNQFIQLGYDNNHHGMFREVGNVYDRGYYEDYLSSIYDGGGKVRWKYISWDDSLPEGTEIVYFVRAGNTPVPDDSWTEWIHVTKGNLPSGLVSRYLQYRARFMYTNPAYFPVLWEVKISFLGPIDIHNYPNPFSDKTTFIFILPEAGVVTLKLYNRAGELVKELIHVRYYEKGTHQIVWDGNNRFGKRCAPGIYLYLFFFKGQSGEEKILKKVLLRGK